MANIVRADPGFIIGREFKFAKRDLFCYFYMSLSMEMKFVLFVSSLFEEKTSL